MSIEVESYHGGQTLDFTRSIKEGHVNLAITHFDDDGDARVTYVATGLPIRDLLIALHALSGQPVAPEPAKPVRPKYRPVSEWFRRRRKD